MENYPNYYKQVDRIVLKDVITRYFFNGKGKGVVSYGMEDVGKVGWHMCPVRTGAFLITHERLDALATDYKSIHQKLCVLMIQKMGSSIGVSKNYVEKIIAEQQIILWQILSL